MAENKSIRDFLACRPNTPSLDDPTNNDPNSRPPPPLSANTENQHEESKKRRSVKQWGPVFQTIKELCTDCGGKIVMKRYRTEHGTGVQMYCMACEQVMRVRELEP
ncbi:hypothetical protein Dda_1519 [Drechslerella dactyloides]|uniref:Uncharacterized protein n=1 Tax=Drechslerella dactyloides TaxID=74499 RepID=A0AAD6NKP8_DREDA|nr:hypothetical protein Dda_1519 [Drechslerella dactyloides]